MRRRKRVCRCCGKNFIPNHRLKDRQKACGKSACVRALRRTNIRHWKKENKEIYLQSLKDWREAHSGYWKEYRKDHPIYTARNRAQSRIRKSISNLGLQKKLDILEVTEKQMEFWNLGRFAKETRSLSPLLWSYKKSHVSQSHHRVPT